LQVHGNDGYYRMIKRKIPTKSLIHREDITNLLNNDGLVRNVYFLIYITLSQYISKRIRETVCFVTRFTGENRPRPYNIDFGLSVEKRALWYAVKAEISELLDSLKNQKNEIYPFVTNNFPRRRVRVIIHHRLLEWP